jgi:hypothetical protein
MDKVNNNYELGIKVKGARFVPFFCCAGINIASILIGAMHLWDEKQEAIMTCINSKIIKKSVYI